MTDKVQKIKEWISKTQDGLMDAQGNFEYPEHEGAYNILCNLGAYIDSFQEEPSKFDAAIQEGDDVRYNEDLGCRVNLSQLKRVAKKEEPVSEDLKKAAWSYTNNIDNIRGSIGEMVRNAFKAGAEWYKDKMMLNTIDATCFGFQGAALFSFRLPAGSYLVGSEVKVIVIKEQ